MGAPWRALLSESIAAMGFKGIKADLDVYIHVQVKPDGFEYYEMLLIYVDDIDKICMMTTRLACN
jgi:hypothetical protein